MLKYCPDKYKTQEMWDKAVDSCLLALLRKRWLKNSIVSAVFSNDCIVFSDLDPDFVTYFSEDIGLNSIILNW